MKTEHETLASFIHNINSAADDALRVAAHRPDQSGRWQKIAESLHKVRDLAYDLVSSSVQ